MAEAIIYDVLVTINRVRSIIRRYAEMVTENGVISIHTENILPIIKKWLYSEKDIFIRELVSNCNDAITKLKKLIAIDEAKADDKPFRISVVINKKEKTLQFVDNGIGMTDEEIKKYINQIAFSGAVDFLEKYKDKADEGDQIIGHFGLGFYSAFMVADKVTIDSLSYQEGAKAVRWISEDGSEYTMEPSDRSERGTTVTLHLTEDCLDYLEFDTVKGILEKYCSFLPNELYLEEIKEEDEDKKETGKAKTGAKPEAGTKTEEKTEAGTETKTETDTATAAETKTETKTETETDTGKEAEEGKEGDKKDTAEKKAAKSVLINDPHPLWLKNPKDCTEEEYKAFYRKVFKDENDPLFWVHLNMDYPYNVKGILYFPKLKHEFETMEGQVKLYYNQVFVADNIKEVIPDFLLLLKGFIDCPDLPLNVSRSFLQNDEQVKKLSQHITKKVSDKLISLFKNERENYNKYWGDINPFIKYGCMREPKFYERVKDYIIFRTTEGEYLTLKDYLERNKEKHENHVYYVNNEKQQAQYVKMFRENGIDVVIMNHIIDNHFVQFLEMKNWGVRFTRVDSGISDSMKNADSDTEADKTAREEIEKTFKNALKKGRLKIKVEPLKSSNVPGVILLSEYTRRMQDFNRMYGKLDKDKKDKVPEEQILVLNSNNSLIKALMNLKNNENRQDDVKMICEHIFDLAMMSHKQLEPEEMTRFIERSNAILERLAVAQSEVS